jgi:hypothetical protein
MSGGEPARLRGAMVSAELFALLGVTRVSGVIFAGRGSCGRAGRHFES